MMEWKLAPTKPDPNQIWKKNVTSVETKTTSITTSFKIYLEEMGSKVDASITDNTSIGIPKIELQVSGSSHLALNHVLNEPSVSISDDDDSTPVSLAPSRKVSFTFNDDGESVEDPEEYQMLKKDRPRAKSLQPYVDTEDTYITLATDSNELLRINTLDSNPKEKRRLDGSKSATDMNKNGLLSVSNKGLLATSMPNGLTNNDPDEELEARDQVSELKLNTGSAFPSTLLTSESSNSTTPDYSQDSIFSAHIDPRSHDHLPKIVSLYSKSSQSKYIAQSAPATPGISLLSLAISPIAPELSRKQVAPAKLIIPPELPKKTTKQTALSAHELQPMPIQFKNYTLDDFHVIRKVGKGGFAKVFLVRLAKSSRKYFALKCIRKSDIIRLKQEKQILNEKNILRQIKHGFIIDLFHTFQSRTHLFMTLEFVPGGDLYHLLKQNKGFTCDQARFYVAEVIVALDYLHSIDIIYRDLKPENVLLDATGHIKLADFGFARVLHGKTRSFCGTPDYIAYEIVANKEYNHSVDWWSTGVLIFELCSGKTPFRAKTSEDIYKNIQKMNIQWMSNLEGDCLDLIQSLIVSNPSLRLGYRLGAAEIKSHKWFETINWKRLAMRQVIPPIIPNLQSPEVIEKKERESGVSAIEFDEIINSVNDMEGAEVDEDPFKEF